MSIATSRADAVRKYFTKTPIEPKLPDYSKHRINMVLGAVLLFVSLLLFLRGEGMPVLLGVAAAWFGLIFLGKGSSKYSETKKKYETDYEQYKKDYQKAMPKPSDEQIDKWMNDDIKKIIEEAERRLDLDHEDLEAELRILVGVAPLKETKDAMGKDGKVRYSHFDILIVFFTEYHVATYQCINSMELGETLTDRTQEFPYKEITNLETRSVKDTINFIDNRSDSETGFQEFTLTTSGANVIQVPYSFARHTNVPNELKKIVEEDTITAIRAKLRDYKKKYER